MQSCNNLHIPPECFSIPENNQYSLPTGGGFNYVLCPHMTAEILMYFSILLIQFHLHWLCVAVFVFANQVLRTIFILVNSYTMNNLNGLTIHHLNFSTLLPSQIWNGTRSSLDHRWLMQMHCFHDLHDVLKTVWYMKYPFSIPFKDI